MNEKQILRKKYSELRKSISEATIEELSLQVANKALELSIWDETYYHIFLTISNKKEINTDYLLHILQGKDKSVVVSKSDFSSGELTHFLLQENTALKISSYGIPEPVDGIEIKPEQLNVVFVPLLAFDTKGNRVGYGKGFYDRFLAKCSLNTVFVGLSFFEPEPLIISNNTDVKLHYCVTPSQVYSFQ